MDMSVQTGLYVVSATRHRSKPFPLLWKRAVLKSDRVIINPTVSSRSKVYAIFLKPASTEEKISIEGTNQFLIT